MTNPQLPMTTTYSGVLKELSAAEAENLDDRGLPKQLGEQWRRVQIDDSGYDKDARTVTMAVSSETPVERWYGLEILSHATGAIRTDRLKSGVALLFNHDPDKHLGTSVSFKLGDDKVLRVTSRFGNNPLALEKEQDVSDRILKDVSIGYLVHEWEITEDKNGVRTYLAVDWELLEDSLVTVPADPTVGVGRNAEPLKVRSFRKLGDEAPAPVAARTTKAADADGDGDGTNNDGDEDDDDALEQQGRSLTPTPTPSPTPATPTPAPQRTLTMEPTVTVDLAAQNEERKNQLRALHTQYPEHFSQRQLESAIALDVPAERAKNLVFDAIVASSQRTDVPTVADDIFNSMSEREQRSYSIANAYRAAANLRNPGLFKGGSEEGGFEREVGETLRKAAESRGVLGLGAGIVIPSATTRQLWRGGRPQERAITSGGSAGTASNFTVVDADPIELLRARTGCLALGAQMMTGLQGAIQMTRQNAAATSNWELELGAATESDPGFDFFTMKPNRLSIANAYTRDFLAQSRFAIESILANDRMQVLARSLDTAAIAGSGTAPVPKGLLNYTGLSAVLTGTTRASNGTVTAGTGGVPLTYVDFNNMEATISSANADIGTLAWLTTPRIRAAARSTPKIPGFGTDFCWPDSKVDARGVQEGPLGYNALCTANTALTGFTANSVSGLHAAILGVWSQMLIGDWGLSEVIVDPYTSAAAATVNITEHAFYDVNFRHIQSFVACTSALPD